MGIRCQVHKLSYARVDALRIGACLDFKNDAAVLGAWVGEEIDRDRAAGRDAMVRQLAIQCIHDPSVRVRCCSARGHRVARGTLELWLERRFDGRRGRRRCSGLEIADRPHEIGHVSRQFVGGSKEPEQIELALLAVDEDRVEIRVIVTERRPANAGFPAARSPGVSNCDLAIVVGQEQGCRVARPSLKRRVELEHRSDLSPDEWITAAKGIPVTVTQDVGRKPDAQRGGIPSHQVVAAAWRADVLRCLLGCAIFEDLLEGGIFLGDRFFLPDSLERPH